MPNSTHDSLEGLEHKHPDEIKAEIDHTRSALSEKIGMLGDRLTETVTGATDMVASVQTTLTDTVESARTAVADTVEAVRGTVSDTVEGVKGTVGGAVESVRDAFDLSKQFESRPWLIFGAAVATGFVLEKLINRGANYYELHRETSHANLARTSGAGAFDATAHLNPGQRYGGSSGASYSAPASREESDEPGPLSQLVSNVWASVRQVLDFDKIKDAAAATAKDMVTGWAATNLPPAALEAMNIAPAADNPALQSHQSATPSPRFGPTYRG